MHIGLALVAMERSFLVTEIHGVSKDGRQALTPLGGARSGGAMTHDRVGILILVAIVLVCLIGALIF